MWEKPIKEDSHSLTDAEINEKYKDGQQRIVTETNREKIPIVDDSKEWNKILSFFSPLYTMY